MTNPFTDDAIDEALKACDVLTDAWDRLVRHQVFDECRDRVGMPEKMLERLDDLAEAEAERDRWKERWGATVEEAEAAIAERDRLDAALEDAIAGAPQITEQALTEVERLRGIEGERDRIAATLRHTKKDLDSLLAAVARVSALAGEWADEAYDLMPGEHADDATATRYECAELLRRALRGEQ